MSDNYDDIINLPRFISKNRKHMSNYDRAAQFAPFAALTGYDDSIKESARLTDSFLELSEDELVFLNMKLLEIENKIKEKPKVKITYFIHDKTKYGGSYEEKVINVKRIDHIERILYSIDNEGYPIGNIVDIEII